MRVPAVHHRQQVEGRVGQQGAEEEVGEHEQPKGAFGVTVGYLGSASWLLSSPWAASCLHGPLPLLWPRVLVLVGPVHMPPRGRRGQPACAEQRGEARCAESPDSTMMTAESSTVGAEGAGAPGVSTTGSSGTAATEEDGHAGLAGGPQEVCILVEQGLSVGWNEHGRQVPPKPALRVLSSQRRFS